MDVFKYIFGYEGGNRSEVYLKMTSVDAAEKFPMTSVEMWYVGLSLKKCG